MNQGFPLIFSIRYAISRLLRKGDVNIYYLKESLHNRTPYLVGLGSVITASSNKAFVWGSGFKILMFHLKAAQYVL